jgi:uncharacterized protein
MRVVLDTNVLVSGLLWPDGAPARIVRLAVAGALCVLHDDRIVREYREVLARPRFGLDPVDVVTVVDAILATGEAVVAEPLAIRLPDPDDLPFVEVAVTGRADAIVTGNRAHFPAGVRAKVAVRAPADLVAEWTGS